MRQDRYVFSQLMEHLPLTTFRCCVARYNGEHKVKHFSCLDQFLYLAFAQLTRLHQLDTIFMIFGGSDLGKCLFLQSRGLRKRL